ncbi:elongation factor 1-beta [Nanoarchaeota archaeon]
MAKVIVTFKIMPESPESDLDKIQEESKQKIIDFVGEGDMKIEVEPMAFGLKAIKIIFVADEDKGSTDDLEEQIKELEGVSSLEVIDVRRAIG